MTASSDVGGSVKFQEHEIDLKQFAGFLDVLRMGGVRRFQLGEVIIEFAGSHPVLTEQEVPETQGAAKSGYDDLMFSAVSG